MATKILFIQTAFVGDLLLSIPTLRRLAHLYPDAEITLYCRQGLSDFLLRHRLVHQAVEIDKRQGGWRLAERQVLSQAYDLLISPHQSTRSNLLALRVKARKKIGFSNWWNHVAFDQRIPRPLHLPEVLRQLSLLQNLDGEIAGPMRDYIENTSWRRGNSSSLSQMQNNFHIPAWASMKMESAPGDLKRDSEKTARKIFIAPGSVWPTKRWTLSGYVGVAHKLIARGDQVIVVGAKDELPLAQELCKQVAGLQNLCGTTSLFELQQLFHSGQALITNDSGAMHLASTAGLPTVAVFGPTVLNFGYRPWQDKAVVVENAELRCRPCGKHGAPSCPLGTHECMVSVSSSQVLAALERVSVAKVENPSR